MSLPYTEESVGRLFESDVDPHDLVWHRDREDRRLTVVGDTDWQVQLENELPREVDGVYIKAGVWHRLLKGTGSLRVCINETL